MCPSEHFLSCAWRLTREISTVDTLQKTSNCYRLPGTAGGPPYGLDPEVWPDGKFVSEFLLPSVQEKSRKESTDGDVVVYSTDTAVVHSGIVQRHLVLSKWGGSGHLWEHGTFEMPASYGWIDRYYNRPT